MKLKKLAAASVATLTLAAAGLVAPAATAQSSGAQDLISTGSSGSSAGSSEDNANTFPEGFTPNPDFQQGEPGKTSSGSSPIDAFLFFGGIAVGTAALAKLITDNNPVLRAQVDQLAQQIGMQGSSGSSEAGRLNGGLDFDLERLARTNGLTELADQLKQLQLGSSQATAGLFPSAAPVG